MGAPPVVIGGLHASWSGPRLLSTQSPRGADGGTGTTVVAAGPAALFDLGQPAASAAGSPLALTVTAFDVFGNVATGYAGAVAFTSTDPRATLPAGVTFTPADAGRRTVTVTLRTAGGQAITARDAVNGALTGTAAVTVTPGPAVRFDLLAPPADTRRLWATYVGPGEHWLVPGAGHNDVCEVSGDAYRWRVLDFLDRALGRAAAPPVRLAA